MPPESDKFFPQVQRAHAPAVCAEVPCTHGQAQDDHAHPGRRGVEIGAGCLTQGGGQDESDCIVATMQCICPYLFRARAGGVFCPTPLDRQCYGPDPWCVRWSQDLRELLPVACYLGRD